MTHIAVQKSLNGKDVDWMEKVRDAQSSLSRPSADAASSNGSKTLGTYQLSTALFPHGE
jgi:4-carboxymuconolactone decarboxylase